LSLAAVEIVELSSAELGVESSRSNVMHVASQVCRAAFDNYDKDKSGMLSSAELNKLAEVTALESRYRSRSRYRREREREEEGDGENLYLCLCLCLHLVRSLQSDGAMMARWFTRHAYIYIYIYVISRAMSDDEDTENAEGRSDFSNRHSLIS
jgi:hypothetical protein